MIVLETDIKTQVETLIETHIDHMNRFFVVSLILELLLRARYVWYIYLSRAIFESWMCLMYIPFERHFWELNVLYQSFVDAVGNFGILFLNISSHLVLLLFTLKRYIITISDCNFYYLKTWNSTTIL